MGYKQESILQYNLGHRSAKPVVSDGRAGSNPAPRAIYEIVDGQHRILLDFESFCAVDLQLTKGVAKWHRKQMHRFFEWLGDKPLTRSTIREYLSEFLNMSPCTYANKLKTLKRFFRDYMRTPELVESFRFPKLPFVYKVVPSKKDLRQFYLALDTLKDQAMFLLYASSGLRRREGLSLHLCNLDMANMMIMPNAHRGRTKNSWITFYNCECAEKLDEFLRSRRDKNPKLFPMGRVGEERLWRSAIEETGIHITPQVLRQWFCVELSDLGVADRYIDAFCGRVPKSVLARCYSDYSPEKLRRIYFNAKLRILT